MGVAVPPEVAPPRGSLPSTLSNRASSESVLLTGTPEAGGKYAGIVLEEEAEEEEVPANAVLLVPAEVEEVVVPTPRAESVKEGTPVSLGTSALTRTSNVMDDDTSSRVILSKGLGLRTGRSKESLADDAASSSLIDVSADLILGMESSKPSLPLQEESKSAGIFRFLA